jgi:hypothetical protein
MLSSNVNPKMKASTKTIKRSTKDVAGSRKDLVGPPIKTISVGLFLNCLNGNLVSPLPLSQIEPKPKPVAAEEKEEDPYKKYEEYWPVIDETTGEIFALINLSSGTTE